MRRVGQILLTVELLEIIMLIIEYGSNGRNIVKLRKDWTPARLSRAYIPPRKTYQFDKDERRVQTALIGKGVK